MIADLRFALRMLVKNPACLLAYPNAGWQEEHIIAPAIGPIGDGHADLVASDQTAEKNQCKGDDD